MAAALFAAQSNGLLEIFDFLGSFDEQVGLRLQFCLDVGLLVVVWRDLAQPLGLDFDDLAHELLGGEDELVVDNPPPAGSHTRAGGVSSDDG